ncbi:MAG TPA: YaiO family outer membrane beta-barrel protein [Sphingomicrobium sp.]
MRRLPILLLLIAEPAIAQEPRPYEEAVAARHAGNPARAVELLEPLVRASPDNADAWVQLGYAQLALGRIDDAEHSFRRALVIAPAYKDASEGIALVERRRAASPSKFRLDVDGAYTWVGRSQRDWRDAAAQLRFEARPGVALTGRIESARRFGQSDLYMEGRLDLAEARASAYLLAGGTPNADFRPKNQIGAGGSFKLVQGNNPTIATIDARRARYPSGTVWTLNPGIEQYLGGGRAWITARWINVVEDGHRAGGWLARGDLQAAPRFRLFAGVADAPDTSEGVVIDTFSIFGGAVIDVDERRAVRFSVTRDKPDGGAGRTQLAIGTGIRF